MPHRAPSLLALALAAALAAPAARAAEPAPAAAAPEANAPAAKLVAVEPIADLGVVPADEKVTHTFVLRNEGDTPIEITQVIPDCACTVSKFDSPIPPHGSGNVTLAIELKSVFGPTVKRARVLSNDPGAAELFLTVRFEARPYLSLFPGYARFIYVQSEPVGTISQTVWSTDGKTDFQVLSVKSPYPYLTTAFHEAKPEERKADAPGKQWRIDIGLRPDAPVGALTDYVLIETNHPQQQIVKVPISGFVRPAISVTPPEPDLGAIDLQQPYRAMLYVQAFTTAGAKITKVESDVKGLTTEVRPIQEGRKYEVVLTLAPGLPKGDFKGTVRIATDSPAAPLVQVPLTGHIL